MDLKDCQGEGVVGLPLGSIADQIKQDSHFQQFKSLQMRNSMDQRRKQAWIGPRDNPTTKSVQVQRRDSDSPTASSFLRSTFVNIKNARYQLDPLASKYQVKELQFPNFGKSVSPKKPEGAPHTPRGVLASIDLLKGLKEMKKRTDDVRKNIDVKKSWQFSEQAMHPMNRMRKKTVGRRILRRRANKIEEGRIEGWKPVISLMDDEHGIGRFL